MEAATGDSADFIRSITEAETGFGYWLRYLPPRTTRTRRSLP
jgi:hypothetical protein